jgi:CRISPR-associated protein Cmr6
MNYDPQEEWLAILEKLKKDKNPLYEPLKDSGLDKEGDNLKLYIPNEDKKKVAQGRISKIKAKLPVHWQNKKLNIVVGEPPEKIQQSSTKKSVNRTNPLSISLPVMGKPKSLQSPLQKLNNFVNFNFDNKGNELVQGALEAAAIADQTCASLYEQLTEKTKKLADDTIRVQFPWRLRVGGIRGFRELLLPVFHPVYGVPYIPSSSLKGAIKAIALQDKSNFFEVERLLGTLDDGIGCVQILDAFPTAPSLSVDMANPQWHWENGQVKYNSVPHPLLSMKHSEFVIGLSRTSRGKNVDDVQKVKSWLEKALATGIGSRVSAGYGRTALSAGLAYSSSHDFQLWTQGIYGADTQQSEFRPVALRGMLRYWFRAIALGIYSPTESKEFEAILFGTIEPKSKEGTIRIGVKWEEGQKRGSSDPYFYKGKILLESKEQQHLTLIEKLLHLSSHIAGIGRGSRRPLHWNHPRMRGCYWELSESKLACEQKAWQDLIQQVLNAFSVVKKPQSLPDSIKSLGLNKSIVARPLKRSTIPPPVIHSQKTDTAGNFDNSNNRCQDVFNNQANIYLVPSSKMKHPKDVQDWSREGDTPLVRGEALQLLYSSPNYKGVNREGVGNSEVGGKLGIPSFVIIKSNFPDSGEPYQTVTVFGADNKARAAFIEALALPEDSIQVCPILFK